MLRRRIQSLFDDVDVVVIPVALIADVPSRVGSYQRRGSRPILAIISVTNSMLPDLEFDRSTCHGHPLRFGW